MTKRDLIQALEPFDDDIQIFIHKNGTIQPSNAYYSTYYFNAQAEGRMSRGEAIVIIHNLKPIEIKTVQVNR